jgi:hypothetical protein
LSQDYVDDEEMQIHEYDFLDMEKHRFSANDNEFHEHETNQWKIFYMKSLGEHFGIEKRPDFYDALEH